MGGCDGLKICGVRRDEEWKWLNGFCENGTRSSVRGCSGDVLTNKNRQLIVCPENAQSTAAAGTIGK